jgi:Fusaric acid resistance protein-like
MASSPHDLYFMVGGALWSTGSLSYPALAESFGALRMIVLLSKRLQWLGHREWLHNSARTLLVVAPGLGFFVGTGDQRGVMVAFAALCLSVPYGDHNFRPVNLVGCALVSVLLMPAVFWLQSYPMLYVLFLALGGIVFALMRRSTALPPRVPIWVLIYILYQSSELHGEGWSAVLTAGLLIPPAALWVYLVCFYLWPWRGEVGRGQATGASEPGMSVPVNSACAALSVASAAAVTFVFNLPHPNWAVWSALTVIRPERAVSLRRSGERVAGAVIGCILGLAAIQALGDKPLLLGAITVVVVMFMVAFEQYMLAVAIRSALAPLGAFALRDDALAAGEARFLCILIGVAIGTMFMLILSSHRVGDLSEHLLRKVGLGEPSR